VSSDGSWEGRLIEDVDKEVPVIRRQFLAAAALGWLVWIAAALPAVAQAQGAPPRSPAGPQKAARPAAIDRLGLLILIRQTLTALDLANKSGNYSILREISAPGFAAVHDASRLSTLFRNQRDRNLDYSGVLVYEPQITAGPEITAEGILRFAGVFPSAGSQISFQMYFSPVNGRWKLFGLVADMGPPGAVAPMEAPRTGPR